MRTPLVWTLRVTISPCNSLPTFLKEPMFAISLLLWLSRAPDHRGLDGDRKAEGDRRRTRSRAGVERRMAPARLCCLARNGRSPGEESRSDAVVAQAIEAQPPSGQIKPKRGRVARATPNSILGRRRGGRRVSSTRGAAWQAKGRKPWRRKRQR